MKKLLMILMLVIISIATQAQDPTTKPKTKKIAVEVILSEKVDSIPTTTIWRDSVTFQMFWTPSETVIVGLGYHSPEGWVWDSTYYNRTSAIIGKDTMLIDNKHIRSVTIR